MPEKSVDLETVVLTILALVSPVIAGLMVKGCGGTLLLNFLLTALLIFPGVWHALYIVNKHHKRQKEDRATSSVQVIQTVPQNSGPGVAPAPTIRIIQSPPAVQTIQAQPATQTIQAPPSSVNKSSSPHQSSHFTHERWEHEHDDTTTL